MDRNTNTTPFPKINDIELEQKLRPDAFSEFTGQRKIVENLKIFYCCCFKKK